VGLGLMVEDGPKIKENKFLNKGWMGQDNRLGNKRKRKQYLINL
jgi:hypothetical protein